MRVKKERFVYCNGSTEHKTSPMRCNYNRRYKIRVQRALIARKTREWKGTPLVEVRYHHGSAAFMKRKRQQREQSWIVEEKPEISPKDNTTASRITNALESTIPRFGDRREKSQAESVVVCCRKQMKQSKTNNESIPESCAITGVRRPSREEASGTGSDKF